MQQIRTSRIVLSFVLLALGSCTDPTGSDLPIVLNVRTDKPIYHLSTDTEAATYLVNNGSAPVYAPMAEYVAVQRLENGNWGLTLPWFTVDGVGSTFAVQPGDTLRALPMRFGYINRRPGTYRFIFFLSRDERGRKPVPETARVSAPFEVQQ